MQEDKKLSQSITLKRKLMRHQRVIHFIENKDFFDL